MAKCRVVKIHYSELDVIAGEPFYPTIEVYLFEDGMIIIPSRYVQGDFPVRYRDYEDFHQRVTDELPNVKITSVEPTDNYLDYERYED